MKAPVRANAKILSLPYKVERGIRTVIVAEQSMTEGALQMAKKG